MPDFFPFPLLIGVVMLAILLAILWRRKRSPSHLFCFSVFWAYLLLVLRETLFPIPFLGGMDGMRTMQQATFVLSHVNFLPFKYFAFHNKYVVFREIALNILLTLPLGFGVSFIARLKSRGFLWLAFAAGLVIEIAQLVISLGIGGVYRTVDITDVILNAAGVLLGYGLFRIFARLYLAVTRRLGIEQHGLLACVHDVASNAGSWHSLN